MEEVKHIAIIMDGNGRWAKKRGLNRSLGHKKGSETLEDIALHALKLKIPYLSVFAFSTENFKRSKEEVNFLMNLFIEMFNKKFKRLKEKGIKVVFSGRRQNLRKDVLDSMDFITNETKDNNNMVLNICLNYGGQSEIVDTTRKIVSKALNNEISINDIDIDFFESNLYQKLPPIDLLIRTSGEYRISNFMLWEAAYAEYYFTDTLFPDFNERELDIALEEFNKRTRKFGGVKEEK